jgi:hypothetical protein
MCYDNFVSIIGCNLTRLYFKCLVKENIKGWLASNHLEAIVKDVENVKLRGFHTYIELLKVLSFFNLPLDFSFYNI